METTFENTEAKPNPAFAEKFKVGDWVTGMSDGPHRGTSQVFAEENGVLQPFSYLQSDDPGEFRHAYDSEIAEAKLNAPPGAYPVKTLTQVIADNSLAVFTTPGMIENYLEMVKNHVGNSIQNTTTAKGRDQIASEAHSIAKLKVRIDQMGKNLVEDWKTKAKVVDAVRKTARDFLDDLKVTTRQPLTDYEAQQAEIARQIRIAEEVLEAHEQALTDNQVFDLLADKARLEQEELDKKAAEEERIRKEAEAKAQAEREAELIAKAKADAIQEERERVARAKAVLDTGLSNMTTQEIVTQKPTVEELIDSGKVESVRSAAWDRAVNDLVMNGIARDVADEVVDLCASGQIRYLVFDSSITYPDEE